MKRSQSSDFSNSRTKKIPKERDNERDGHQFKQKMITDFSVQMMEDKNTQLLKRIAGRNDCLVNPEKVNELDNFFYGM